MNRKDQDPNKGITHPELTVEGLFNKLALFFFGTVCLIIGFVSSVVNYSFPVIGNITIPLLAIFAIIYYILLLDFVAYYSIKTLGIVVTNYRKYRVWFFGGSLIVLVTIVGVIMKFYAIGNPYLEAVVDVALLVIIAVVIEIVRPIITPKIMEFLEKLQKKEIE